jgi:hypothetical protein
LTNLVVSYIMECMGRKKNPHAQALGSLGGKARARSLSPAERTRIASQGGKARVAKLSAAELSRIAKLGVAARKRKRRGRS